MLKAIVYKSNTGYTKNYAKMLSENLNIPYYNIKDVRKYLNKNDEIIYLGWICAGRICGYSKVNQKYNVKCCGAVGIYPPEKTYIENLKKDNKITQELFYLRGGIDRAKLNWMYKKIIDTVAKLMEKENKEEIASILKNGANFVSEENVKNIGEYIRNV